MMANGRFRPQWPVLISILLALLVTGCSNSNQNSGLTLVDEQGDHPSNFLSTHPGYAVSETNQCTDCHGGDLTGGISGQSCFLSACHHDPEPNWVVFPPGPPQEHGLSAKAVPGSLGLGFVSCQICHAQDFTGDGAQASCLAAGCHGGSGQSPHPAAWGSADTYTHTTTAEKNASVCAQCHLNGANSPIGPPSPPAQAGTAPGCFNSTLCHGENPIPHPTGSAWWTSPPAPQPHGNDAKAAPGSTTGFAYCQICHGTPDGDFSGGSAISCYTCHGADSPHPSGWLPGDAYIHTSTDEGNASVCAYCHYNESGGGNHPPMPPPAGSTTPGCFNSTLCHGRPPAPHPQGSAWWTLPPAAQPHGNDAKAAPGATTGFAYCQVCHGTPEGDFSGGYAFSCYLCHQVDAPHPGDWLPGDTYVHTSTIPGNASICAYCHYNEPGGGNHPPMPPPAGSTTPGCFNSTLCHD